MTEPSAAPRVIPSYDPAALYATDLREVFGRSWLFAAHDAELAGGGWLRREVGGRPIVITRDGERARAFFNVCPHRGARLVERDTGPCRAVACAWHGLSFRADGALAAAPRRASWGGGLDGVRLREVRCERWAGLWMVCFDDDAPPLAAGARLDALAREHRMDDLAVIARTETVVACSWQLGVEGGLENLHLPVLHRRSGGHALDVDRATYEVHGEHSLVVAPYRPADLYAPTGPFGRAIAAAGVELLTPVGSNAARENTTALLFPHVSLSFVPHHLWVMVMQPIGPAAALQIHLTLALPPRDEDARRLLGVTHAAIAAVLAEDVAILEGLQSNLGRGLVPPIPLSDHEIRVAWFRDALAARRSA